MTVSDAQRAKELGEQIAVFVPFSKGYMLKAGKILNLSTKLRSGATVAYATIEWSRPNRKGMVKSDVRLARVKTVRQALEAI